jgi:hypothetical protein
MVHLLLEDLHLDHQLCLRLFGGVLALFLDALELGGEGLESADLLGEGAVQFFCLDLCLGWLTSTFSSSPKKVDYF